MTELQGQPSTGAAGSAWGEGHLALDAIVAYVDEELSTGAQRRALEHLSRCRECATEVVAQTQARLALRASEAPSLPSSLLHNLRDIPSQTALPEPPAGLAVGPTGELFELQRQPRGSRRRSVDRWVWLGAGAIVSGLAIGALVVASNVIASAGTSAPRVLPRATLVAPRLQGQDPRVQSAILDSTAPSPAAQPSASVIARPSTPGIPQRR
jgi:anti-sigma factor RsiW